MPNRLTRRPTSFTLLLILTGIGFSPSELCAAEKSTKPNIVYILCDDLGYGDIHCFNPQRGKIPTPHADRLAAQGMSFTDAHSGSSVCTPTRYGILTGRYCWRSRLQSSVLLGYDKPLIPADRLTVGKLLQEHGYKTACIGKWHLGMDLPDSKHLGDPIKNGPTTRGFDYYFGISASLDMPPYAFIENDKYTQAPTATKKWLREGPAAPDFEAVDVLPHLTSKACDYIAKNSHEAKPFFLYLALTSPHTPILPSAKWKGKSGLGDYGDFVMATDEALGEVMSAIDKAGIADNTLLVFTSDNGCSPAAGIANLQKKGHYPSADLRGSKADIWDGGHRIPFIVRWNGVIKPGSTCRQLTCLTDLMATAADVIGARVPETAGEDSVSILPLLKGRNKPVREAVVHHSINGIFALRQGDSKIIFGPGSGGWTSGGDPKVLVQLYNIRDDIGEQTNLQAEHTSEVARLTKLMNHYISEGRSTPGRKLKNDVPIKLWKAGKEKN